MHFGNIFFISLESKQSDGFPGKTTIHGYTHQIYLVTRWWVDKTTCGSLPHTEASNRHDNEEDRRY